MKIGGIDFPRQILNALRDDKLVVFAGAGVSMGEPAGLPDFKKLAKTIAQGTGEARRKHESEDRFLGRLKHNGVGVHRLAARELSKGDPQPTDLHRDLLKLYAKPESIRIVTTNFDTLFEQATVTVFDSKPKVFTAPALPLGRDFYGIVHVHGALDRCDQMVLTDEDFGRAYLTEGWARRFLVELFRSFTVLFIGYSHDDTIMNYLARALPVAETKPRFVLTYEGNSDRWQVLGIKSITYLSSPGHEPLNEGMHGLANYARRSVLDWQREITELAQKPPPLDEEQIDFIKEALSDAPRTRFFTAAALGPEWIDWLDERKYLDGLFGTGETGQLGEQGNLFARWLAEKFAWRHAHHLFLLFGRHDMRLHPFFWYNLGRTIGLEEDLPLDTDCLSRWVSVLLATAPPLPSEHVLLWLAERCIKTGLARSLIEIFDAMTACHLALNQPFTWFVEDMDDSQSQIDVKLAPASHHSMINKLWEEGLKPKLDLVAEPLLELVIENLATQHRTLCAWQKADREWNPASFGRSAVEPHEQDNNPESVDVLIDAARDCLEWLVSNQPEAAAQWSARLAGAEAPLLRRLAVHTLSARNDVTANEKIDWLLARMGLHDPPAHHELFRILQQTYPEASQEQRKAVINAVLAYRWPKEEDEDRDESTAYIHFNWLHWLHKADPDCMLAKQALDDVLNRHQDIQPREHPDFTHYYGSLGSIEPQSPWTVEELLSRPADKWIGELLAFQPAKFHESDGPVRNPLLVTVTKAVNKNFEWGHDLADKLTADGNWDTDLWGSLMSSWLHEPNENKHREAFCQLSRADLYSQKHGRPIADILYTLVENGGMPYAFALLPEANEIALKLWHCIDRDDPVAGSDDWQTEAINDPAGVLAKFWLESLSIWLEQQDRRPDTFGDEYRTAFSRIVQDQTIAGTLGKSVLLSRFSFLLNVDETWTKANLLPLLKNHANADEYQAAWDGLLNGYLSPVAAELLEGAFLEAVSRIESDLKDERRRKRFISDYVVMLAYFANDPFDEWIPKFFQYAEIESRKRFAFEIGNHVRDMNEAQQQEWWGRWFKRYWENRLEGVPAPLDEHEIKVMLHWLPSLRNRVFPEAVDLAVGMDPVPRKYSSIISEISQGNLSQSHPEAVARLLIFLGKYESHPSTWREARKIVNTLLQSNLPCELKQTLKELAARMGL